MNDFSTGSIRIAAPFVLAQTSLSARFRALHLFIHFRSTFLIATLALLIGISTHAATAGTIDLNGSLLASDATGPVMLTVPGPIALQAFNALDNGFASVTTVTDFPSFAGVDPLEIAITFGDLERLSTVFSPAGCAPVGGDPFSNCATVSNQYGEGDGSPSFFAVDVLGVGTVLSGEFISLVATTDSDISSPGFGSATASGSVLITGGLAPYLTDVLAMTGGTGIGILDIASFNSLCTTGADPCSFSVTGSLMFVPEPSTALLIGGGLAVLSVRRRRADQTA